MEIGKKLQVIYFPGTWGNTVRWMLDRFYKDSKKVDNQKVKDFFNYQFTYPTYKEGLDKILNDIV